jgi:hypothetical protein
MCGLCTECVKSCPYDNVGLYVQPPLTSVVAPVRRRVDIAIAVVVLFGLVVFQQVNALSFYAPIDGGLNQFLHFPGYPNPIGYFGFIAALTGVVVLFVWALRASFGRKASAFDASSASAGFTKWFVPLAYALIPLMAVDFLARQLPKFWLNAPKLIAAISDPFGAGWNVFGTAHAGVANVQILSTQNVILSQVALIAVGTIGAIYAAVRIVRRDMHRFTDRPRTLAAVSAAAMALIGAALSVIYVAMAAAT